MRRCWVCSGGSMVIMLRPPSNADSSPGCWVAGSSPSRVWIISGLGSVMPPWRASELNTFGSLEIC